MSGRPKQWRGPADRSSSGPDVGDPVLGDAELIAQVRAGESDAFGLLVRRYQDRVYNACWRICGRAEEARDLTQDAFLKAFERLDDFRSQSGFYTWLFRIAVNLAISSRRRDKRVPFVSLSENVDVADTQADALGRWHATRDGQDPAEETARTELHGVVAAALANLDPDHRAVIVLRDIEGFDYTQIAEVLNIPRGTVKSRLYRARTALHEAVRPALEGSRKRD